MSSTISNPPKDLEQKNEEEFWETFFHKMDKLNTKLLWLNHKFDCINQNLGDSIDGYKQREFTGDHNPKV